MIWFLVILLIVLVYLWMLCGRTRHPSWDKLRGFAYAHRGLHGNGVPENSMAAFRLALEKGYGIELDVHLMKDGTLAVIHDTSLKRTAGADVKIEDLTPADLELFRLEGTEERIPLLSQVLSLYHGQAPLIIELKSAGNNAPALCRAVCDMLSDYKGAYCIESFDPRCIAWLKKNRPKILRGQLSANFLKEKSHLKPWPLRLAMTANLVNCAGRPDFIAYDFFSRKRLGVFLCRKLWKIQGVAWTIRTQEDLDTAVREGWIPIFEGFCP